MKDEFKTIETQEQLDGIIKDRLASVEKKHSEKTAELQNQIKSLTSDKEEMTKRLEEYDEKISGYEKRIKKYEIDSVKMKIAKEAGIPEGMIGRLMGDTEEEIRKDAESLAKFFPKKQAPQKSTETAANHGSTAEKDLANWLNERK